MEICAEQHGRLLSPDTIHLLLREWWSIHIEEGREDIKSQIKRFRGAEGEMTDKAGLLAALLKENNTLVNSEMCRSD